MNERMRPISPEDVVAEKLRTFPGEAIESFNELLVQNDGGGPIYINQDDVITLMEQKGLDRAEIFRNGWLNVEDMYRGAGWKVEYDKPGYNESYSAHFIFSPKRKRTIEQD